MTETNNDQDWTERAEDATEEARQRRGAEDVRIEDEPSSEGEISEHPERQL